MRLVLIVAMLWPIAAGAQKLADPAAIKEIASRFEPRDDEPALRCQVTPLKPALTFALRQQAGYTIQTPLDQYSGSGHNWSVVLRVTPEGKPPVYLIDFIPLPPVPETKSDGQASGGFLIGEGRYTADLLLYDDVGRICRKQWKIDATRTARNVSSGMPPATVADFSLKGLPKKTPPDAAPIRLTVLLDAAPHTSVRTAKSALSAGDRRFLLGSLSALLDRMRTSSVRLVVFNLDEQTEIFRRDGFVLDDLEDVADAMTHLQPGVVDYRVLQNRSGPRDLITGLINRELHAEPASDLVVFLGPHARYGDKIPPEALTRPRGGGPQFVYLEYRGIARAMTARMRRGGHGGRGGYRSDTDPLPPSDSSLETMVRESPSDALPDIINRAMERMNGKTISIRTPAELAKALIEIERRYKRRTASAQLTR